MQAATSTSPSSANQQPLRLLLVRSRPGELPWLASTIGKAMAPVDLVEVIGFANALWRLGHEHFDSVLLDLEIRDPAAMAYCREQIGDVAAVPVLDLREDVAQEPGAAHADPVESARPRERAGQGERGRRALRVPWQRRSRRQPEPATEPEGVPAG